MRLSLLPPLLFPLFLVSLLQSPTFAGQKSYIVYLGEHTHGLEPSSADLERATNSHYQLLGSFLGSPELARDKIFYSYTRNINGFAAFLDDDEAAEIAKHPGVVSVFLNKKQATPHNKVLGISQPRKEWSHSSCLHLGQGKVW